ncbi:hypothetical protein [Halorussus marinus]|uniref:hypothetical protein n=1 Tax=Halorussus marinus TaxID=2505976 RepID=UPI00106EEA8E|nr:hypothetical protein [Halorussus marinus]
MKKTLSAVVGRVKRYLGSSTSESEEGGRDAGPDLYECRGCGEVFISRPSECSNCENDDFANVGKFR